MIPNFALSLSLEGLRLLHRGTAGWTRIGEVALDSADLSGDLARLRAAALARAPEGLRTKLLIPNDQIRYLTLDGERDAGAVATALEGTTPYAVDELVVDFVVEAGRTHVAAVARETLEEAESFAREHALEPVAFAAVPEPGDFPGEVLFGPVPGLGAAVARDDDAVREVPPEPAPVPLDRGAPATPDTDDDVPPEPVLPQPEQPSLDATDTAPRDDVDAPDLPDAATPLPLDPVRHDADDAADTPDVAMVEPPLPEPAPDASAADGAAAPQGVDEDDDLLATTPVARTPEPQPQAAPPLMPKDVDPAGDDPAQTEDARDDEILDAAPPMPPRPVAPPVAPPLPPRGEAPQGDTPPAPEPDGPARRIMPPAMPRPGAPPAAMPAVPEENDASEAENDAETAALAAGAALVSPAAGTTAPAASRPEPAPGRTSDRANDRASERERMTVFGARSTAPERRPGRFILIAALVAVAVLALLASLWTGSSENEPQAGLLRDAAPELAEAPTENGAAPATPQDPAPEPVAAAPVETAPEPQPAPQPDYDDYPAPDPSPAAAVSPAEAERIYAATGVWLRSPRLPLTPRAEPFGTPLSVALEPVSAEAGGTRLAAAAPDGGLPVQADPPPAGSVFARDARGFIAATAEGTVTPQGLVIYEGRPDVVPPTRPGTVAPPSEEQTDAEATPEDDPSGEPVTILVPDTGDEASEAQPAAPPVVPPTRPDTVETDEQADAAGAVTPGGVALDALRPTRRPEEAAPEPLAAYEGPRPPLRPEGLVPDAGPQLTEAADAQAAALAQAVGAAPEAPPVRASVADALASLMADAPDPLANATPQAVPTARRPDQRPRNFDRVVARSRATTPPSSGGGAQPVANATVAPDGPVPGSVARASTSNNAINLSDINLIGVYGKPGSRRALIRMQNGRYLRVGIGDSLDGGRVTAIGDDVLNYVRRGRTQVLKIPD